MMKRILSLTLAVALIIVLALPVSAANDSGWIELLETNSVQANGDNWFTMSGTSGSVTIPVGSEKRFRKIDMLIWNQSGQRPTSASVTAGGSTTPLTLFPIGTYMTRIIGKVPNTWYENVTVSFKKSSTASSTYEVLSCKMTSFDVQEYVADASVVIGSQTYSVSSQINISAANDITATNTTTIRIDVKDWHKYDELTIWGSSFLMSLDSFRASISTSGLPITTNYIACNDAGSDYDHYYVDGGNVGEGYGEVSSQYGKYLFCVTIDLTNVDRTISDPLYLYMTGQWNQLYNPSFTCQYVNGHVFTADTSEVTFWVRFKDFLNTCFSGLTSAINTGFSNVSSWISSQTSSIVSSLSNGFSSVGSWISNQTQILSNQLAGIWQEIETGFTNVGSWFEQYLGVTDQEQETIDDLDQSSDSISQGASEIHDFEQTQQDTLTTGFGTIQGTITFTNFAAALVFVQKYANMTINGISGYTIVYTLPLFLGLFFYLCSRIPGVTRWKSPPPKSKGG